LKRPDISEKFPNFDNRTIPKLAKTKSLEKFRLLQGLNLKLIQVSSSSTFYMLIFCTKVLCTAFLQLRFGFGERILAKKALSYKKHTHKMLMKLTTGGTR